MGHSRKKGVINKVNQITPNNPRDYFSGATPLMVYSQHLAVDMLSVLTTE